MKKILQDRKALYLVLGIMIVSVFTLSVAYAAMSTVLEIHGNSEVVASSWDIHLENVKVNSGSVSANSPQISGTSSVGFDVELNTPGDFYEFTVDVVNEGTIDAMIDSVVKTPNLTTQQAKYIKYEITYENGESISNNQTLKKGTATPIKVRVEYRKDIVASDLPSGVTELSLKLTLVYVQSDGSGNSIPNNGKLVKVASGDGTKVGDEVCIGNECFYVISSTDTTVTMLSKYNLNVGYSINNWVGTELANTTGIQDETAIGYKINKNTGEAEFPFLSTSIFSSTVYWGYGELKPEYGTTYPSYVYDANSTLYPYVNSYSAYLTSLGISILDARVISYEELISLGCSSENNNCSDAPSWVYSTSYWTGSAQRLEFTWGVKSDNVLTGVSSNYFHYCGVRPVITISRNYL